MSVLIKHGGTTRRKKQIFLSNSNELIKNLEYKMHMLDFGIFVIMSPSLWDTVTV